jgi:endonuclease/exonuclease/phosphatase family metal-dependent hydrolase
MFHVVHLISPITPDYFLARNRQLETLARLMQQATTDYPDHLHVLIGDFNTSPWSPYYVQFQEDLGDERYNQTRQTSLLMTWKLPFVPWLRTQIDHVWTR